MGWNILKVRDIAESMSDAPFGSNLKTKDYVSEGVPVLQGKNINGLTCDWSSMRYVSKEKYDSLARHHAKVGSIVFPKVGTIGKVGILSALGNEDRYLLSTNTMMLKPNPDIADLKYVYYYFSSPHIQRLIQLSSSSSVQPVFNFTALKNFEIPIPPLEIQHVIASTLSSLDAKIDLLRQQNETLEALGAAVFREWFLGGNWQEISLYDQIQLVGGGTPKTGVDEYWGGEIGWLSGGDIASNHKGYVSGASKTVTKDGVANSSAKLLPRNATIISARGTVGKYCLLAEPMTFSQSNYGVMPADGTSFYFTYLVIDHAVERLLSAAYGSVFDTITTRTFKNLKLPAPPVMEVHKFEQKVSPFFEKMETNTKSINNLIETRDLLLPKLMSGKVKITQ